MMTHKMLSLRIPVGLYEQLEREALERRVSVAVVILDRVNQTMRVDAVSTMVVPNA